MLKLVIAVILLSYPVFGNQCLKGYSDCRAVDFAALDERLQSLLKELPGGVFETELEIRRGMSVGIKIENITVSLGAEEVGVHWNTDENGIVSDAKLNIENFEAELGIHLEVDLVTKLCFMRKCRSKEADIYGGDLTLDLDDAHMELEMTREGDKLKSGKCWSDITELTIRSERTEEVSPTVGFMMRMAKRLLGSFMKGKTGKDMQIPQKLMDVFMEFVTNDKEVINKPIPVCDMVGSIFELMNGFQETDGSVDILTEFITAVKENEEFFVDMKE